MDHMKSDNFGELLAALSGSGNSSGASSNDASHVVNVSQQGNNGKRMHSQQQQQPQPDFQHQQQQQQQQPQYVWQAVPPQAVPPPAQHHMMQMQMPTSQLNYGYPISQQMQMQPQAQAQQFFPPHPSPPPHPHPHPHPNVYNNPNPNHNQMNQATAMPKTIPIDAPAALLKEKALPTTKKSFPIVLLTVSLIILGFAVLAVWYYSKKNVLANAVPSLRDSLEDKENDTRLPPPKLFLVSEQEDDATKLMQDSHVIENLERYLSAPPSTPAPAPTRAPSSAPSLSTSNNAAPSNNAKAEEKKRDLKSKPQRHTNNSAHNNNKQTRFTKLSDVLAEEEEEDEKVHEEVEVEVNGFKKKMPKRIDSDSPEISEFMKKREQAEKENLKWIESQRENPRVTEEEEENEDN
jgi:hypothetical protein